MRRIILLALHTFIADSSRPHLLGAESDNHRGERDSMPEANQSHALKEARGLHGQLELWRDKVRIQRQGLLAQAKGRDKEVPITEIASLQFREAGLVTHGLIRFVLRGREAKQGRFRASDDEDTVQFHYWERRGFEAMKRAIQQRIEESRQSG